MFTGHVAGFDLGQEERGAGEKPMAVEDTVALSDQPPAMLFTRRRIPLIGSKEQQSGEQGGTVGYASVMTRENFLVSSPPTYRTSNIFLAEPNNCPVVADFLTKVVLLSGLTKSQKGDKRST